MDMEVLLESHVFSNLHVSVPRHCLGMLTSYRGTKKKGQETKHAKDGSMRPAHRRSHLHLELLPTAAAWSGVFVK